MRITVNLPAAFSVRVPGETISWRMRGHTWPARVLAVKPCEDGRVELDLDLDDVTLTPHLYRVRRHACEPEPKALRVVTGWPAEAFTTPGM